MIYKSVDFKTQSGSLIITSYKVNETIHIPYTDKSYNIEKGRKPTVISVAITAFTEVEKNNILTLLHSTGVGELTVNKTLYKQVESSENFTQQARTPHLENYWIIGATFKALDPIPYSAETGEALYA